MFSRFLSFESHTFAADQQPKSAKMESPICNEFDEIVAFVVRSASYKEPTIMIRFSVVTLLSKDKYFKKKKDVWNQVKNRMIDVSIQNNSLL